MAFIYNLSDTWNDAATTWNGIKLAVTNTSSDASSKLLNLTVTGASTASFVVDKSGNLVLNGTVNKITFTAPATAATLTLADNSTFATSGAHSSTFTFTGTTTLTFPTSGTVTALGNTTTGSGAIVLETSPTLVSPALGTPSGGTLTNCTGFPASGLSGLGSGVAAWLATPSSANLRSAVTDETGTGALVFATSPALVTPDLGTPTSATLTNATGLPISTGVSGLGTNVATFLATPSSANLASAVTDETGSGSLVFGTGPTIGSPTITGTATFNGSTSGTVAFKAPAIAGTTTFTLPSGNGTSGYVLVTDGLGNTSWAVSGGAAGNAAGVDKNVQFNDAGSMAGNAAFNFDKTTASLELGVASTTSATLKLYNSASANAISIASGNNASSWTMTLPTGPGTNGYVLSTDGSGNTSWVLGGGGVTINTTTITGGTSGRVLYDNAGTVGEKAVTGTGDVVLATSPTLITPALGTPSSGNLSSCTNIPVNQATGTLPVANGGTGLTAGTSGGVLYYSAAGTLASSAALAASSLVIGGGAGVAPATTTTGTGVVTAIGNAVNTAGGLLAPAAALTANALVIGGGSGTGPSTTTTGTGILTFLGTPSSANLASAVTDETGSGSLVFGTSPTFTTSALFPAGTVSAPGIAASGDTNTGIFFPAADTIAFAEGGVESARFDSGGNLLVGTTTSQGRFTVKSAAASGSAYVVSFGSSTTNNILTLRDDGLFGTGTATNSPYNYTTPSGANLFVDSGGNFQRSTSSRKYKTEIQDAIHGLSDVLNLRSVTYKGKNDGDKIFGGLIAEEVDAAGLTEFVVYDSEGQPDALHYGNMAGLFVKAIQELAAKVAELEAKI